MKRTVDVNIPLGPIHPCFKEPARLKCEAKGERIVAAEVELGYMKKGIERIMKGRPWQEVMFLAERVCGICSVIHNMVFIEAMEQISGISVPPRAAYLRVIANELDRMQSHLLANFSYCYTIEHETLGMYLLDLREQVMDELERLTGARVTCAYIIPGGVRCDIPRPDAELLQASLDRIERDLHRYSGMFAEGPMIALRSRGVGILTLEAAQRAHVVGPTARASGIPVDCRLNHSTYQQLGFVPVSRPDCDNFARVMLRFDEVFQSIGLIRKCLKDLPKGVIRGGGVCKAGETRYSGEAPRGELTYFIKSDEFGRIVEIQIQTPSIMNIEACCHEMIIGADSIADVTSTFVSADPCIACTER
jgi:energy-converting hydrogenase A subunit O